MVDSIGWNRFLNERLRTSYQNILLRLPNDRIKRSRDRILRDWWRHHVAAEKEENEENEGARGEKKYFLHSRYYFKENNWNA